MTEKVFCSMLSKDDVVIEGNSLTFKVEGEKFTFYLTEEAFDSIRKELNKRRDYEMNEHRQQVEEGRADWAVEENL